MVQVPKALGHIDCLQLVHLTANLTFGVNQQLHVPEIVLTLL